MGNIDFQGSTVKIRIGPVDLVINVPEIKSIEGSSVDPQTLMEKKNKLLEDRRRIDDELKGLEGAE